MEIPSFALRVGGGICEPLFYPRSFCLFDDVILISQFVHVRSAPIVGRFLYLG